MRLAAFRRAKRPAEGQRTLWDGEVRVIDPAVAVRALRERTGASRGPACTHTCVSAAPPLGEIAPG